MRSVPLTKLKAGISRIRTKGGASPDALSDLLNGYLTTAQTIESRPGTYRRTTPGALAGTKGLYAFNRSYYVFGPAPQAVPAGFKLGILRPPVTSGSTTLAAIPFVGVAFGRVYVAATFADGSTYHYWLEIDFLPTWAPNVIHNFGDRVVPTGASTGYVYEITNRDTTPAWTAGVTYGPGIRVQPRTYNGFRYLGQMSLGSAYTTGDTEPVWPTTEGAYVMERRYTQFGSATAGSASTTPSTGSSTAPAAPSYSNRPGNNTNGTQLQ